MTGKNLRIVFMGTPEFAVAMLKGLVEQGYNIVGVITSPDKPAGRGQKMNESEVKKYALEKGLTILQPEKLKDPLFIEQIKSLKADLQIVVAFRMLPEVVWQMPAIGTFNLHASLLPHYRGAAPINWVIINGEKKTGLTTFIIDKEIDTGRILLQKEIQILQNESAGDLHDKMMPIGTQLVIDTVELLASGSYKPTEQSSLYQNIIELKTAPKIFKEDCRINWNLPGERIYNQIRGLSPYPGAWTTLVNRKTGKNLNLKLFETEFIRETHKMTNGALKTDKNNILIAVSDGFIKLKTLQLEGKKRLKAEEMLRGYSFEDQEVQ